MKRLATIVACLATVAIVVGAPSTASAHTDFESSDPAEGAVVDAPVSVVTISFTAEAEPVNDGFTALNAEGTLQQPVDVSVADGRVFTVTFDPPLAGGTVGVRWEVAAPDTHPIAGAFAFEVTADAPTTSTAPTSVTPTTVAIPPTAPAPSSPATSTAASAAPSDTVASSSPVSDIAPGGSPTGSTSTSSASVPVAGGAGSGTPPGDEGATPAPDRRLDEFLAVDDTRPGETLSLFGRIVTWPSVMLAIGVLVFSASAERGSRAEVGLLIRLVRGAALAVAVGAVVEYVGVGRAVDEGLADLATTRPGLSILLRLAGGLALAFGVVATVGGPRPSPDWPSSTGRATTTRSPPGSAPRSLSAAATTDASWSPPATRSPSVLRGTALRWTPTRRSWPALAGIVAILASFWLDGHTVTRGNWALHSFVNVLHVAAAAVWVGGVVAMAVVAWTRYRVGESFSLRTTVVRFSAMATVALGTVVVAGSVMAVLVLDSFGELTSTEWGRILLLKVGAVAIAAAIGAYNHFVLLPIVDGRRGPSAGARTAADDAAVEARLRSNVTAEGIVLVFVAVVTAWLVAAAS